MSSGDNVHPFHHGLPRSSAGLPRIPEVSATSQSLLSQPTNLLTRNEILTVADVIQERIDLTAYCSSR